MLTISLDEITAQAKASGRTTRQVMCACLEQNLWPLRFARNHGVFSAAQQGRLLAARAAIIGCGGLGSHVATLLARAGVGALTLCDGDVFSESNLNRQLLCRESNLGRNKAEVAAEEIAALASHVDLSVYAENFTAHNAAAILQEADIVLDCLDSIPARLLLQQKASAAGLPMVHAAIAGEEGFFALLRPGDNTLQRIYGNGAHENRKGEAARKPRAEAATTTSKADAGSETAPDTRPETVLGVPTVTPAATAAFQAALALQVLGGKVVQPTQSGEAIESCKLYHLDLLVPLLETLMV